jgi:sigma-B regulation protein RsbU (phosphoserine phosphatase)
MVKLAATSQRSHAAEPAALLSGMNAALCGNTQNQFVTAAYLHLDAASASLRYSAAGHPPLLLLRQGVVTEIVENGLLLGVFPSAAFSTAVHTLAPGDRLVLYTDGIIEAADAKREEFGQSRLQALLQKGAPLSPQEAADLIIVSVQEWSKSQDDDLTVLVCDYTGSA